ncbi:MAG TPA: rod shape-determining protein MreD [Anaerolineae bacterium]|nr:rod shape-determining protein MreD [Anaerolineae bacterium]
MSLYFTIPFLALLAIFQATAAPQISIASGHPDLLLLCVMSWELVQARGEGYSWALIGGIGLDLLGGGPFGASILGLLAVTLVADWLGGGLFRDRVALPLITALAGTFAFHGVYLIVLTLFGWKIDIFDAIVRVMLPSAVLNMILSPIAYRLMSALHRRVTPSGLTW